jgi:Mn2+/Fe2+ NRAMP family transporter
VLGPGLVTGASDDDPSGIATYSQGGAQFGYGLAWSLVVTYPLMVAMQMISARLGRTTGHGLAGVLRLYCPSWLLSGVVMLLLVANIVNLGADLGAMADALDLLLPSARVLYVLLFAAVAISMQLFLQYTRYVAVLKWLTLALLRILQHWPAYGWIGGHWARQLVWPDWKGTMLSATGRRLLPFWVQPSVRTLFFWQASEEVEDMHVYPRRVNLVDAPVQGKSALRRIRVDTLVGMAFSNLVALAILVTTAATLNVHGVTDIQTSAEAAEGPAADCRAFCLPYFYAGGCGHGSSGCACSGWFGCVRCGRGPPVADWS